MFQYPLRVEIDWNRFRLFERRRNFWFQYPLRVEIDWNFMSAVWRSPTRTVSVPSAGRNRLERWTFYPKFLQRQVSVPSAGRNRLEPPAPPPSLINKMFQYPLRVEIDWNLTRQCAKSPRVDVSVPSAGRNRLELHRIFYPNSKCRFQYPLRVEIDWNRS